MNDLLKCVSHNVYTIRLAAPQTFAGQTFALRDMTSPLHDKREQFRGLNVEIVAWGGMCGDYCVRFTDSVEHIVEVMSARDAFWTEANVREYLKNDDSLCEFDLDQLQ